MALRDSLYNILGSAWHVASKAFFTTMLPAVDGTAEAGKVVTANANAAINVGGLSVNGADIDATPAEIDRVADVSDRLVSWTTTPAALAIGSHESKIMVANKADGLAFTLPAATGSGAIFKILVGTTITSSALTVAVTGNDTFFGLALTLDGDGVPANAWSPVAGNNRITLDGSNTGGVKGDWIEMVDFAADCWSVHAFLQQSATEATPFSTV